MEQHNNNMDYHILALNATEAAHTHTLNCLKRWKTKEWNDEECMIGVSVKWILSSLSPLMNYTTSYST